MTPEELKADVARYIEDLSARTGVDIDVDEVWKSLQDRMVNGDPDWTRREIVGKE